MGYVVAALLFGSAFYVWYYNASHTDSLLLLPLLDLVPSLRGDPRAQGDWSWRLVLAVAIFVLLANLLAHVRRARRRRGEDGEA